MKFVTHHVLSWGGYCACGADWEQSSVHWNEVDCARCRSRRPEVIKKRRAQARVRSAEMKRKKRKA